MEMKEFTHETGYADAKEQVAMDQGKHTIGVYWKNHEHNCREEGNAEVWASVSEANKDEYNSGYMSGLEDALVAWNIPDWFEEYLGSLPADRQKTLWNWLKLAEERAVYDLRSAVGIPKLSDEL